MTPTNLPNKATKLGKVIVIDDDADTLATLELLVHIEGYECETYLSASAYLEANLHHDSIDRVRDVAMCFFCDVNMPGISGLEFQATIADQNIPLVLMSGDVTVNHVIEGFRLKIHDFLLKPIELNSFVSLMHQLIELNQSQLHASKLAQNSTSQMASLSQREIEVCRLLIKGASNQEIADALFISLRTVKFHRKNIYDKLKVSNLAELMHACAGTFHSSL